MTWPSVVGANIHFPRFSASCSVVSSPCTAAGVKRRDWWADPGKGHNSNAAAGPLRGSQTPQPTVQVSVSTIYSPDAQTLRSRWVWTRRPYRPWCKRPPQGNTIQQTHKQKDQEPDHVGQHTPISALRSFSSPNADDSHNCNLKWEERLPSW